MAKEIRNIGASVRARLQNLSRETGHSALPDAGVIISRANDRVAQGEGPVILTGRTSRPAT